ncbi:pyruvate kinase [Amphiplicatus metriothermophilus]|uniref:Pyruvate kinase n=1 Tax=Amphiplicatus metriothermophilus TaxID=1519374 RepID=A0A239PTZ6_9PROT|nr:pyruvate kinase [Amphiplicatus metriothermophilus]MBB5519297.1 pyruvate kinase [Amphiplicatus metriothermophilus]SNT73366.1 pyruvate kinase [Amphiplicatus metriothermophilus]
MRNRYCKIVATVGPASSSPSMLRLLHQAGVDVFRLNFSHGDHAKTAGVMRAIREAEAESGAPIAVFADLQGPKIRTGVLKGGGVDLKFGAKYRLMLLKETDEEDVIPIPHPEVLDVLGPGDILKLDDGKLQLTVKSREGEAVIAQADAPGRLTNRKGVNLPGRALPISALTDKDRADLAHALDMAVDYVALSFVQRPDDIAEARDLIGDRAGIIAKIEKPTAVEHLDEILALSDAIMVARGDLGVELPPEQVPGIQRRIVRACRAAGKPVIVATHMLESMVESISPTRAEASDVSTAVYQGADAVMLSAETAVGRHPPTAVAIMDRIIVATEADEESAGFKIALDPDAEYTTADAITLSARRIAEVLECRFAVAYTKTGSTAKRLSRDRPRCTVIAATPNADVGRRLALHWGLAPVITEDISDFNEMLEKADRLARENGARDGERIVILAGYPFGRPGKTNTLKISRVGAHGE